MINLTNVTLVFIDCVYPEKTIRAMKYCLKGCSFASVKFLTSLPVDTFKILVGLGEEYRSSVSYHTQKIDVVKIPHIDCLQKYSRFVIHDLHKHFDTEHVMIAQADGFILNPDAWQKEFLDFDYIGAPWWWYTDGYNVGNGGFCIRSKRLMKHLSDTYDETEARYGRDIFHPEDHYICRTMRKSLEDCSGFTFAPGEIAGKFSVENGRWNGQFGFHDFETDISAWPGFEAFNVNPSVKAGI
jgi:hypothetical protein